MNLNKVRKTVEEKLTESFNIDKQKIISESKRKESELVSEAIATTENTQKELQLKLANKIKQQDTKIKSLLKIISEKDIELKKSKKSSLNTIVHEEKNVQKKYNETLSKEEFVGFQGSMQSSRQQVINNTLVTESTDNDIISDIMKACARL